MNDCDVVEVSDLEACLVESMRVGSEWYVFALVYVEETLGSSRLGFASGEMSEETLTQLIKLINET